MARASGPWFVAMTVLAGMAYGGRPLVIDDAHPVDQGTFELEAGLFYSDSSYGVHRNTPIGLTYGVAPHLEIGIGLGWHFDRQRDPLGIDRSEEGFSDIVVAGKWRFLEQERAWFDHALAVTIKFPTASHKRGLGSGKADCDLMWIGTHQFGESLAMDVNVGYSWIGKGQDDPNQDLLHYGVALRYALNDRIEPVMEIAAFKLMHDSSATSALFNAGVRWKVMDHLTLDFAAGVGLTGDAPNWTVAAGLTWTF